MKKLKILIFKFLVFSFSFVVALSIWLLIENYDLKKQITMYKDMIIDYSGNDINIIESAVIDKIISDKNVK